MQDLAFLVQHGLSQIFLQSVKKFLVEQGLP